MLAAGCSPRAARTASALASSVPPMQNPSVFALSALVIASAASIAVEHAVLEVVVPGQRALLGARVAPGHQEHRVALGDRVRDEGVRGLQVEDVVLVDARRDDHQRALVDLRRWSACTGSAGSARSGSTTVPGVVPTLRPTSNADSSVIAMRPSRQVLGEQAHALDEARAAGLQRELHRLGVGGQRVGRAERVHHLAAARTPTAPCCARRAARRRAPCASGRSGRGRSGRRPRSAGPSSTPRRANRRSPIGSGVGAPGSSAVHPW